MTCPRKLYAKWQRPDWFLILCTCSRSQTQLVLTGMPETHIKPLGPGSGVANQDSQHLRCPFEFSQDPRVEEELCGTGCQNEEQFAKSQVHEKRELWWRVWHLLSAMIWWAPKMEALTKVAPSSYQNLVIPSLRKRVESYPAGLGSLLSAKAM